MHRDIRFGVDLEKIFEECAIMVGGIIFLANMELGYLTPPVGMNLYLASFRFDKPIMTVFRASLPFLGKMRFDVDEQLRFAGKADEEFLPNGKGACYHKGTDSVFPCHFSHGKIEPLIPAPKRAR